VVTSGGQVLYTSDFSGDIHGTSWVSLRKSAKS